MTVNLEKIPLPSRTNVIPFDARTLASLSYIRFLNLIEPPELFLGRIILLASCFTSTIRTNYG